jgi:hypothetical protein
MATNSTELTRAQLVGMIAALRGHLYDLIHIIVENTRNLPGYARDEAESARKTYYLTAGDTDDADLVNGGFDQSWREPPKATPAEPRCYCAELEHEEPGHGMRCPVPGHDTEDGR